MPVRPQFWYDRQGQPINALTANDLLGKIDYVRVALTEITSPSDPSHDCRVSTVWLALDQGVIYHAQNPEMPPVLFETMIFGGRHDLDRERWCTEDAARIGHAETVAMLRLAMPDPQVRDITAEAAP